MANRAVRDYLTQRQPGNTLLREQDTLDNRRLRRELLETALKYYNEFVKQRRTDPQLRERDWPKPIFISVRSPEEIGTTEELIESFQAAGAVWEELASRRRPEDPELKGHLARCHLSIRRAADGR